MATRTRQITPADVCYVHRQLRKLAVSKVTGKLVAAKLIVNNLKDRFKNVHTVAKIAGETPKVCYQLFSVYIFEHVLQIVDYQFRCNKFTCHLADSQASSVACGRSRCLLVLFVGFFILLSH